MYLSTNRDVIQWDTLSLGQRGEPPSNGTGDRVNGMLREEYLDQPGLKRNRLYDILPEEVIRQMREAAGEDKKD